VEKNKDICLKKRRKKDANEGDNNHEQKKGPFPHCEAKAIGQEKEAPQDPGGHRGRKGTKGTRGLDSPAPPLQASLKGLRRQFLSFGRKTGAIFSWAHCPVRQPQFIGGFSMRKKKNKLLPLEAGVVDELSAPPVDEKAQLTIAVNALLLMGYSNKEILAHCKEKGVTVKEAKNAIDDAKARMQYHDTRPYEEKLGWHLAVRFALLQEITESPFIVGVDAIKLKLDVLKDVGKLQEVYK